MFTHLVPVSASLDMESFHKVIDNLGSGGQGSVSSARQTPQGASREITKMTNFSLPTNGTVTSQQGMYNTFSRTSPSRLATCGSTVRRKFAQQVDTMLGQFRYLLLCVYACICT